MRRAQLAAVTWVVMAFGCGGVTNGLGVGNGGASGTGGLAGSSGFAGTSGDGGSSGSGGSGGTGGSAGSGGACPGYSRPSSGTATCRSDTDCKDLTMCVPPGDSLPGCGTCQTPVRECEPSTGCPNNEVCFEYQPPCPCYSGLSSRCQARCTATSCPSGEQCASSGLCEPTSCKAGYACPTGSRCAPASTDSDPHGCQPIPCTQGFACPENTRCTSTTTDNHGCVVLSCKRDTDCDCGACVNGACAAGPGICVAPAE